MTEKRRRYRSPCSRGAGAAFGRLVPGEQLWAHLLHTVAVLICTTAVSWDISRGTENASPLRSIEAFLWKDSWQVDIVIALGVAAQCDENGDETDVALILEDQVTG